MKNRIFAGIAAVAVASTCLLGLTACGDEVNSERTWKKAWSNTASLTSYILQIHEVQYNEMSKEENSSVELMYDGAHKTAHYQLVQHLNAEDKEQGSQDRKNENYYVDGNRLIRYTYLETGEWEREEMTALEWASTNMVLNFVEMFISVEGEKGEFTGQFSELYDYATYDASKKEYTLRGSTDNGNLKPTIYKIRFEKGYLSRIDIDGTEGFWRIQVFRYNATTVNIPNSVTGTEQKPGTKPEEPGNDSPMTETEWKAAISASLAATSYTATAGPNNKNYYDGVNGYVQISYGMYGIYYVADEDSIVSYMVTNVQGNTYYTHADQTEMYDNDLRLTGGLASFLYVMQVDGSERTGTVSDLFDLFTYDAETDSYKCDTILKSVISGYEATFDSFEVSFKDGKVGSVASSYDLKIGSSTSRASGSSVISDYNQTVITLPEGLLEYIESLKG